MQLDCLDKFTHVKTFHEVDNEVPHLKGGIPILYQSLESPFTTPSPPHEEVPSTSPWQQVQLNDVIERIGILNLEEDEASLAKQPGPS